MAMLEPMMMVKGKINQMTKSWNQKWYWSSLMKIKEDGSRPQYTVGFDVNVTILEVDEVLTPASVIDAVLSAVIDVLLTLELVALFSFLSKTVDLRSSSVLRPTSSVFSLSSLSSSVLPTA